MKIKKSKTNRALSAFNAQAFLDTAGVARKVIDGEANPSTHNGDAADNVMYIQKRGVKLSVVNGSGKEALGKLREEQRAPHFFSRSHWRTQLGLPNNLWYP
jgi:hypothetical protein